MRLEHAGLLKGDHTAVLLIVLNARGIRPCGKHFSGMLSSHAAYAASCILFAKSLPEVPEAEGDLRTCGYEVKDFLIRVHP